MTVHMAFYPHSYPVVRLTPDQVQEICALREQGWGHRTLAKRFGVSTGAIHYHCLKHGAISPTQVGPNGVRPQSGRAFTPDEDARLVELAMTGISYRAIAIKLARPYTSVRIRLLTLAMHDEIAAA